MQSGSVQTFEQLGFFFIHFGIELFLTTKNMTPAASKSSHAKADMIGKSGDMVSFGHFVWKC